MSVWVCGGAGFQVMWVCDGGVGSGGSGVPGDVGVGEWLLWAVCAVE